MKKLKRWHIVLLIVLPILFVIGKMNEKNNPVVKEQPAQVITPEEQRKKDIEKQFSAWDGSHRNLVELVKKSMNDPKSFEHVETKYWANNPDHIVVKMTYRGTNAFNAVVTAMVSAEVDYKGNVLKVQEEE